MGCNGMYLAEADGALIFKDGVDQNLIVDALRKLERMGFDHAQDHGEYFLHLDPTDYDDKAMTDMLKSIAGIVEEGEFYYTGEDKEVWRFTINSEPNWTEQMGYIEWGEGTEIV